MLGNKGTGKTSLISKYSFNDFSFNYFPTLGVDFNQVKNN